VCYLVAALAREAGIGKHLTPHGLRHSAITIGLDADVSLRDMQDFARHADPTTTRRYDRARHALNRHATYAIAHSSPAGPEPPGQQPRCCLGALSRWGLDQPSTVDDDALDGHCRSSRAHVLGGDSGV